MFSLFPLSHLSKFQVLLNARYYGLPPTQDGSWYYKVERRILRVHPQDHIDAIKAAIPANGSRALDADTHVSPGSLNAALRGVGAMTQAVDMVIGGDAQNAFAAVRPPGCHRTT